MSRDSFTVKIGRKIQNIYGFCSFLDIPFDIFAKKKENLVICLLAPPRSGSTLTYQLFSSSIKCSSLRNLSNLLYSTPILADRLCSFICKNHKSSFRSSSGFVDGLCGEAEGLKFWKYWLNQGLTEDTASLNLKRLKKLKEKFSKFSNKIIVTGYLGHVFSVDEIENMFDNVIFIHLKRDLLSNAYSLLKYQKKGSYSAMPNNIDNSLDKYEFPVKQIVEIHKRIESASVKNLINITYEDVCDNPAKVIETVKRKASELGFALEIKTENIPEMFNKNLISSDYNEETLTLYEKIRLLEYEQ